MKTHSDFGSKAGLIATRVIGGLFVLWAIYAIIFRFTHPGLTETQLFVALKIHWMLVAFIPVFLLITWLDDRKKK